MIFNDCIDVYEDLVSFNSNKYKAIHRWFPFVEGFSSEFVRGIIGEQKKRPERVFDPFGGVGTTSLTCQELGINCYSIETNPFFFDVARTKLDFTYSPEEFTHHLSIIEANLNNANIHHDYPDIESKTIFQKEELSRWLFNKPVMYGILDILSEIGKISGNHKNLFRLALASQLMNVSNVFRNGKCLSYKKSWKEKKISRKEVHKAFLLACKNILLIDIRAHEFIVNDSFNFLNFYKGDSREYISTLSDNSIDLVITSPPYLNSRDYTDIYRAELWILGYVNKYEEERELRRNSLTSHVQLQLSDSKFPQITELKNYIKFLEKIQGSLWNKNIPFMVKKYFSDMEIILKQLKRKLRRKSKLYINISNSAYGGQICEVDIILSKIAINLGYEFEEIRIARYLKSSNQQKQLSGKIRESVIVLKKK